MKARHALLFRIARGKYLCARQRARSYALLLDYRAGTGLVGKINRGRSHDSAGDSAVNPAGGRPDPCFMQTQCQLPALEYSLSLVHGRWLSSRVKWRVTRQDRHVARISRSPCPHARLMGVDTSAGTTSCRTTRRGFFRCPWRHTGSGRHGRSYPSRPSYRWHRWRSRRSW